MTTEGQPVRRCPNCGARLMHVAMKIGGKHPRTINYWRHQSRACVSLQPKQEDDREHTNDNA